ncbi:MAG: ABC transporter permease [Candidatus Heimdallarchaeota archaeon]|nr:ABC transporter permease [Candidatus Heimdallarchaeota archaeon]
MKILTKKLFREIWRNKFRSISIVLVIAISITLLSGLRAGHPVLFNTYELNQEYYNVADGTFSFSEPIGNNNISSIKTNSSFLDDFSIDRIESRIYFMTEILFKGDKFPAAVIGVNFPNQLNQLVIEEKSSEIIDETTILDSNTSCLVETHFAGRAIKFLGQNVSLNDEISISFPGETTNFTIKGIAQDSYYSYIVDEVTNLPLFGNMAIIWINLQTAQNFLYEGQNLVNQLLYTVDERFDREMILTAADGISSYLTSNGISPNTLKFVLFDETAEYKMFEGDAGAVDKMGTIFGILGLIICIVIIYNTLSKMINAQRKNIGLFLSLGSKKRRILLHYSSITLILSSFGIIVGIPFAYGLAIGMAKLTTTMYGFHQIALTIPVLEFVYGGVATFTICFLCSIFSALPITSVTPREAMSAVFTRITTTGKSIAERTLGWIPLFKSIHMLVPLREVFLKKRKSLITILALITSMIFLVNSLAMVNNLFAVMSDNFEEYNTYDVQVVFETPASINNIVNFMEKSSSEVLEDVNHYEVFVGIYTKIIHNNELLSWTELVCYQENSSLRNFNVIKGEFEQNSDLNYESVLLGNTIAGKYDVKIGDEIDIGILGNYSVTVTGLVGEMIDYAVLWTYEAFQENNANLLFGIPDNWVNGVIFTVNDEADLQAIRAEFEDRFNLAMWTESEIVKESVLGMMEAILGILILFLILGILIGVLFSFQSMYMAFVDRHQDFLSFKAMGTKTKYLRNMIFWENAILSTISLILTIPFGYLTYVWSMDYIMGDSFYMPSTIPGYVWPIVLLISFFSLWLATYRLMRKIKKMNLADELRQSGSS